MEESQQDALLMMGYKVFFPPGKTPFPAQVTKRTDVVSA